MYYFKKIINQRVFALVFFTLSLFTTTALFAAREGGRGGGEMRGGDRGDRNVDRGQRDNRQGNRGDYHDNYNYDHGNYWGPRGGTYYYGGVPGVGIGVGVPSAGVNVNTYPDYYYQDSQTYPQQNTQYYYQQTPQGSTQYYQDRVGGY